jgi:cell division transport system permease protein
MSRPRRQQRGIGYLDVIKHLITIWFLQHVQAFIFSLGQLCRNPVASLLTASVIGISLALPAGFYVILENTRRVSSGWEGTVQITAFLKTDVSAARGEELAAELGKKKGITGVEFISRDQALAEFRRSSGFGEALNALQDNPLPALLLIRPQPGNNPEQAVAGLLDQLKALPEIENAQFDQRWVRRLNAMILIVQRTVIIMAIFLGMAVLVIIGNTIRMLIYHRRSEIEIAKLFGATDGFIQRPFLYSGFWYGFCGGLLAWLLVSGSLKLLEKPASHLAELYAGKFVLAGLNPLETLILVGTGIFLGLIGSWISVSNHLRAIEPA